MVFHNGSNYDHHFIIKKIANEFEEEFERLREKKKKMQNFFRSNKKGNYKLHGKQFVENIC